jgi:uncharacterized protein YbaP (TraB family)
MRTSLPGSAAVITLLAIGLMFSQAADAGTCCVWRIANVKQPFYLVGTIHALSSSDYPLPKGFEQALKDSQQFLFEMDMHPDAEYEFAKKFSVAAAYPKGDDIRRHIHPQAYVFLHKNFAYSGLLGPAHGMNKFREMDRFGYHHIDNIEQLRPWAVAYYIWGIRGFNDVFSKNGVDNYLAFQARREGKEIRALETAQEHVDVLAGMTDTESELLLLDAIVRGDKRRDDYNEIRAAWKKGDVAKMWELEQRERKLNPGGEARLLDMRNVKWIPEIKAEINSGKPTAIVVGAGHYPGYNGLLSLLEHQGYKIEQL